MVWEADDAYPYWLAMTYASVATVHTLMLAT